MGPRWPRTVRFLRRAPLPTRLRGTSVATGFVVASRVRCITGCPRIRASFAPRGNGRVTSASQVGIVVRRARGDRRGHATCIAHATTEIQSEVRKAPHNARQEAEGSEAIRAQLPKGDQHRMAARTCRARHHRSQRCREDNPLDHAVNPLGRHSNLKFVLVEQLECCPPSRGHKLMSQGRQSRHGSTRGDRGKA